MLRADDSFIIPKAPATRAIVSSSSDGGSFIRTDGELPRFDKGLPEKHSTIWRKKLERWRRWWCGELRCGGEMDASLLVIHLLRDGS
jgi:hypothetical protein